MMLMGRIEAILLAAGYSSRMGRLKPLLPLSLIHIFEIEKELDGLPPEQKKKERLDREKPLLEAFWSWACLLYTSRCV